MKKRFDHAWFNFVQLFQWHRVIGIGSLSIIAYVLVFFVFGKSDVSGFLPRSYAPKFHWPSLPTFFVEPSEDKTTGAVYTVPTRKISREEQAQIQSSGASAQQGQATPGK